MTTEQKNRWNACAEAAMMGFCIPIESTEQLTHMVKYCLKVLKGEDYRELQTLDARTEEIVSNATQKYNSSKVKAVYHFVVNDSDFGVMMTFVRENKTLTLKSGKMRSTGLFAWVENIDAPDCSEAGYVYFENRNGKTVRIG